MFKVFQFLISREKKPNVYFFYRSNLNSKEDRIHVESQLCLATQGPLCLDPDPVVSIIARYVKLISTSVSADKPFFHSNQYNYGTTKLCLFCRKSCVRRQKFATPTMRRYAKHFSQVGLNRKRKLEEIKAPPELKMFDFIQGLKRPNPQDMLQQHQAMMRANLRAIVQSQQQVNNTLLFPFPRLNEIFRQIIIQFGVYLPTHDYEKPATGKYITISVSAD